MWHAELDDWFRRRAGRTSVVARVRCRDSELGVVGFYSLSFFKLDFDDLPNVITRRLPRYDGVPAALIGRLARDIRVRGKVVGELLVADAVRRILSAAQALAVFAIIVDAKDERAATFYEGFGFPPLPTTSEPTIPVGVVGSDGVGEDVASLAPANYRNSRVTSQNALTVVR